MALTLKVGEVDLSDAIRVAHDQGMDPANPDFSEPQFTGLTALGEGQAFAADTVNNREMAFPLILSAEDTDALYALIREVNAELVKGKEVEYRSGSAGASTFFDLERGRLEEQYEFWLDNAAKTRAMLHLWVRPYGHTGTYRTVVPSVAATGPQTLQATGILGDALAQVRMRVDTTPSYIQNVPTPRMVAYGISQSASYRGIYTSDAANQGLSELAGEAQAAALGASGAVASGYLGVVASPRGEQVAAGIGVPNLEAHEGRHRLLMVARTRVALASGAPAISIIQEPETPLSPDAANRHLVGSVVASHSTKWQVYDFGVWSVPPASGRTHYNPENKLTVGWTSAQPSTAASLIASPALQVSAVVMLPLDVAAGIHLEGGWLEGAAVPEPPHLVFGPDRVSRMNASDIYYRDESGSLRGGYPELPPTGSPVASGPLKIVFMAGDPTNFLGNKPIGVELAARERFRFLA